MKKIILSIALLAATISASAQLPLRIEALGNFSSYSFGYQNRPKDSFESKFAFGIRGLYNVMKDGDNSNFEVGFGYQANKTYNPDTKGTMTIHNLMVPFGYSYEHQIGNSGIVFAPRLGFFLAYAVGGKTVLSTPTGDITNDPFAGDGGLKKFDIGSDDQLAFIFADHYCVAVGFQFSMFGTFSTLCKDDDVKAEYDNFYISVAYQF